MNDQFVSDSFSKVLRSLDLLFWDCGPVVKILPSTAWGVSLIPGQRARIPHASRPKKKDHLDLLFVLLLSLDSLFSCVYICCFSPTLLKCWPHGSRIFYLFCSLLFSHHLDGR